MNRTRIACLVLALCAPVATLAAQDFRGAITGRVTDTSGAVLPGVTVTATNVATNVATTTTTNSDGVYNLLYLAPGPYTVTIELQGFKKEVREGIEVRVGDRLTLDSRLDVGQLEETITVTAAALLLERSNASAGQVIDEKRISLMPLSDGNPFVLSRLVPGVAYTGDLKFSRPFDNAGTSSINADGSSGGNEFTLDGSPNMASGRRVAFVPPAGAVQEFKVQTASFDAGDGHTAGAMVNVTLKSGTNALKGQGYYYIRDEQAVGDRLLRQQSRRREAGARLRPLRRVGSAARCGCRSTTAAIARSSSAPSSGCTTSSRSPDRRRCRPTRCATATSRRCWRRTSRSTIRDRAARERVRACARRSRTTSSRRTASTRSREQVLGYYPGAEPAGRRAGAQQLLLDQSAHRRFLLDLDARRSPAHRQAAAVRPLRPQRSHARRAATGRARSTASARSATTSSASTTASPTTTSTR